MPPGIPKSLVVTVLDGSATLDIGEEDGRNAESGSDLDVTTFCLRTVDRVGVTPLWWPFASPKSATEHDGCCNFKLSDESVLAVLSPLASTAVAVVDGGVREIGWVSDVTTSPPIQGRWPSFDLGGSDCGAVELTEIVVSVSISPPDSVKAAVVNLDGRDDGWVVDATTFCACITGLSRITSSSRTSLVPFTTD